MAPVQSLRGAVKPARSRLGRSRESPYRFVVRCVLPNYETDSTFKGCNLYKERWRSSEASVPTMASEYQ